MNNQNNRTESGSFKDFLASVSAFFSGIGSCLFKLRKFIMAVPVLWLLAKVTLMNYEALPDKVGILLQKNGEYSMFISKEMALFAPVGITVFCLLMMFASKKTLQPWVISIFTLTLPLLLWLTSLFA